MDAALLEGLAVALYERLGFDPAEPISTLKLARAWHGPDVIVRPTTPMTSPSMTSKFNGRRIIAIKRTVAAEYEGFFVGHELGHLLLAEEGYQGEDEERCADAIGAALLAPMPAVRRLYSYFGSDFGEVADAVESTQTWAALRLAEALGIPRAVITPHRLYVRGPETFEWGPADELRRIASSRRARPGLTKKRLTDDKRRVVLDVEELDLVG